MKRLAISLSVCLALVGAAATGHAKRGGGKAAAPAADENAGEGAGAEGDKGKEGAPASESLDTTGEGEPAKIEETLNEPKKQGPTTTLSWQDIVVVPRKAFLKSGRLEIAPIAGITVNDNLIRHYMFAVDLNYFLSDVWWVGLQGQYFVKQFTPEAELVGLQFNRTSTLNKFLYGGAVNFGAAPAYGKFALANKFIFHWEIWASGGFGVIQTEVIPRDPAQQRNAFKNTALTPNVAIGSRIFVANWLTLNFALRDYIMIDRYEPVPPPGMEHCEGMSVCKSNADSALVHNLIAYVGVGMYLPTKFSYKTPR
jgi:outer membrane beta-barrel protein